MTTVEIKNRTPCNLADQIAAHERAINAAAREEAIEAAVTTEIIANLLANKPTRYGSSRSSVVDAADVQSEINAYEEAKAFAIYLSGDHIEYARRMAELRTAAIGRVAERNAGLVIEYRRRQEAQEDAA